MFNCWKVRLQTVSDLYQQGMSAEWSCIRGAEFFTISPAAESHFLESQRCPFSFSSTLLPHATTNMDNNVQVEQISDASVHVDFPMLPLSEDLMDHFLSCMNRKQAGSSEWREARVGWTTLAVEQKLLPRHSLNQISRVVITTGLDLDWLHSLMED